MYQIEELVIAQQVWAFLLLPVYKGDERLERPSQLSLVQAGKVAWLCIGGLFDGLLGGLFGGCRRHSGWSTDAITPCFECSPNDWRTSAFMQCNLCAK